MSIKIERGDGTAENAIKAGTSNELLYNDKEVLLKENFDLGSGLLPPDLTKTQEWTLSVFDVDGGMGSYYITVPEDGWIVRVGVFNKVYHTIILRTDYFIKIDGFGGVGTTPGQYSIGDFYKDSGSTTLYPVGICNVNCPYPVKKGQVVSAPIIDNVFNKHLVGTVTITFAPNKKGRSI